MDRRRTHLRFSTEDLGVDPVPRRSACGSAVTAPLTDNLDEVTCRICQRTEYFKWRAGRRHGHVGLEAQCGTCGEHFVPADENDLVHLERADGSPCGGSGTILGEWR